MKGAARIFKDLEIKGNVVREDTNHGSGNLITLVTIHPIQTTLLPYKILEAYSILLNEK